MVDREYYVRLRFQHTARVLYGLCCVFNCLHVVTSLVDHFWGHVEVVEVV